MNKNIIIGSVILLLLAGVIIVLSINKDKGLEPVEGGNNNTPPSSEQTQPSEEELATTVNIQNNMGVNEVEISGIVIKNVMVVNEIDRKRVEFTLESENPLPNMTLEVALLNDDVVNRKMKFTFTEEKYSEFIIMDFTNDFNNPNQIYFNIEKN